MFTKITCEGAALAVRGLGPPAVPSKISRVFVAEGVWPRVKRAFSAANAAEPALWDMNRRREDPRMIQSQTN